MNSILFITKFFSARIKVKITNKKIEIIVNAESCFGTESISINPFFPPLNPKLSNIPKIMIIKPNIL